MEKDFDVHSYIEGLRLFNQREFFEAHEVLEDVWRAAPASKKKFFQGLIQVAVGLHHHSQGNIVGAVSVLKRAAKNLSAYPDGFEGIRISEVVDSISTLTSALERGLPLPPIPRLDEPEC
jgi:predicted metal-dependent hydrolase